jgi:F-type H+-transporting ATPase subunit delta
MAKHVHIGSAAATAYARALLDLAKADNQAQEIGQELTQIRELLDADSAFEQFLSNPAVGVDARLPVLQKAFDGKVNGLTWNFLRLLNQKGRLSLLRQITDVYDDLLDELYGKVEVDVTVAQRLDEGELEDVRRVVSEALKRDAVVHQYVDDSIKGGQVLRLHDKLIDTSVRAQLAALKQQMLAARPKPAVV